MAGLLITLHKKMASLIEKWHHIFHNNIEFSTSFLSGNHPEKHHKLFGRYGKRLNRNHNDRSWQFLCSLDLISAIRIMLHSDTFLSSICLIESWGVIQVPDQKCLSMRFRILLNFPVEFFFQFSYCFLMLLYARSFTEWSDSIIKPYQA